jgi:outer membrane receptor protein involved in Fe transport
MNCRSPDTARPSISPIYPYEGALPAELVKSYQTVDARLGWPFAKNFELLLAGQNLLQPRYPEFDSVLVERSGCAQISWRRAAD